MAEPDTRISDERLKEIEAWAKLVSTFPPAEGHPPPKDYAEIAAICTELLALRAAASTSTEGAGVKGLVWDEDIVVAETPFGSYTIGAALGDADGYQWTFHSYPYGEPDETIHRHVSLAIAAAQADFERRVLSCLTPPAPKVTTDEAEERG